MCKTKKGKKVLVGLSGGVDSSVSLVLLKNEGFCVEAVFVKVWQPDFIECNWRDEMRDAMRICSQLKIPFHFLNLEEEYKREVADYMIEGYKNGITPNPDIMCNKYIKFGHLFDFAKQKGFDYVATGHYARTSNGKLFRGEDKDKDQSYFLWTLGSSKLKQIIFPIGHLKKENVRKIAKNNNLANSSKKDSQGVCILGPIDIKDFLKKYLDVKKGKILNTKGEVIGSHEGAVLYTIGERHGFRIDKKHKGTNDKTHYVIKKDVENNTLTVSDEFEKAKIKSIKIKDISFVDRKTEGEIEFQTRYRQKPQKGYLAGNTLKADFSEIPAIGQSVVFYECDECLGGGIIEGLL